MDYTFTTQGFLKNILQGVCKEKIHIKTIIIIIIIQEWHNVIIKTCHEILITTYQLIHNQSWNHNQYVCVIISLILLCMHLL